MRALLLLGRFLRPYRARAVLASLVLVLSSLLLLGLGQGVRHVVDAGLAARETRQLDRAALGMAVVVAAFGCSTGARYWLVTWLGERVVADLRAALFDRLLALSPARAETLAAGDLLTRMLADAAMLQGLVGSAVSMWLRSALLTVGAMLMLLVTSPHLALIVVAVVPLVILPLVVFGRRERRLARAAQDRVADLGADAAETLGALRTVQAYTHEPLDRARFRGRLEASMRASLRRAGMRALLLLGVILLGFGGITFALWVGGREVVAGRLSTGALSAFVFYAVVMASSLAGMSELWGEVQRAAGAGGRLADLLAEPPPLPVAPRPVCFPPVDAAGARVSFDRVSFCYPTRPGQPALDGLSLEVAPGETVALVGPSGAGKSTLFQLLLRFYDPQSGSVRLDGVDLRAADPALLRRRIATVAQEPVLFAASAADNIRYGRPDASDVEIRAAARDASAGFIARLPQGFDTPLGERGVRLSGGERQRIAIARAVLRNAPLLLLDEATSALDAEAEALVQQALARLQAGRTTLVIAHRLATVRRADRIVVMQAGRIVAQGTHAALMEGGGLYARLAGLQLLA